jgi:hypothetical protein
VEFSIDTFTVSYFNDEHSTIIGSQVQTVEYGNDTEGVTVIPAEGYQFVKWSDGLTQNPRQDRNVNTDISVSALVEREEQNILQSIINEEQDRQYSITSSAGNYGTISPLGINTVTENSNITLNIIPNEHYTISDVIVDGISVGPLSTYTFLNVRTNHTISATFEPEKFVLSYYAGENGSISGNLIQVVNYKGNGTAVEAVANTGYHFINWSDGFCVTSRMDTDVTGNISVTANFSIDQYTLSASAGLGGTISPIGQTNLNFGSSQFYSIEAGEGYEISDVLVDDISQGVIEYYEFTNIDSNHTISVSFSLIPLSVVTVNSVIPISVIDTRNVSFTEIHGTGFLSGATVKLTKDGEEDIICSSANVNSDVLITGVLCNTAQKSVGDWNIVVTNSDTGFGTLTEGFEIQEYQLGDISPLGGYIFYVNPNSEVDGWKYMEASPNDLSTGIRWADDTTNLMGASEVVIGSGETNTNMVTGNSDPVNSAIELSLDYSVSGIDDWFLPSEDELSLMYTNLHLQGLGDFNASSYWSSTEADSTTSRRKSFGSGTTSSSPKANFYGVRAVRRYSTCQTYTVSYNGNGSTGGDVPIDSSIYLPASSATILDQATLVKTNYVFVNWNTMQDGSGTSYDPASVLTISNEDIILYAQWYIPNYTVAILPDTQSYVRWKTSVMTSQLDWLVDNKDSHYIEFVAHVGDIVQNWDTTPTDWEFVQTEMNKLKTAGIPYSILPGNHDYAYNSRNSTVFNSYFPLSNYSDMSSYAGAYDTNSDNMYFVFTVDKDGDLTPDDKLLILSLEFGPREEVVEWANQVLTTHSDVPAIVVTHAYLQPDGDLLEYGDPHAASNGYGLGEDVYDGDELWDELIYPNNNVRFVFCGHDGTSDDGSALRISSHEDTTAVYQVMTNYQYFPPNNAGYLVLLNFTSNTVSMKTYSPWTQAYKTDAESQADFSWTPWAP